MTKNDLAQRILSGELPPHAGNKNVVLQMYRYNQWLAETGRRLYQPDLATYRDYLLTPWHHIQRPYALFENPAQL